MKKIIFILFLFLSCYLIYIFTKEEKINYLVLGDSLSKGNTPFNEEGYGYSDYLKDYLQEKKLLKSYNKTFTNQDYRLIDLINLIDQNQEITLNNKKITINQLISQANLITISIGMNEIYYKLSLNNDHIYQYMDSIIMDTDYLLNKISKLNNQKVIILGYYNPNHPQKDLFKYLNFKLEEVVTKYKYTYLSLEFLNNHQEYFPNPQSFNPNLIGYQKVTEKIVEIIK